MKLKLVAALCFIAVVATAQRGTTLPKLKVSADRHFLVQDNGKPFFYLADTAWELFHRLGRKDAAEYLKSARPKAIPAIQAVALAEFDGLVDPNAYGKLPLIDKDPTKPAINPGANPADPAEYDYWDHVDYIVDEANGDGLYVALLPTWASWVVKNPSRDESIFTAASAHWAATAAPWASRTSGAPWRRVWPSAPAAKRTTKPSSWGITPTAQRPPRSFYTTRG